MGKVKKGSVVRQAKDGEIQKLKNRIKKLEKEKSILVTKLNTAEAALANNIKFLKGSTEDLSVEDLIEAAKTSKNLREIREDECPKCKGSELKITKTLFGTLCFCECGYTEKRIEK